MNQLQILHAYAYIAFGCCWAVNVDMVGGTSKVIGFWDTAKPAEQLADWLNQAVVM